MVFEETLTGLLEEFSTVTVICPRLAPFEAAPETAGVVMTSLVAVEPVTTVTDMPEPQVLTAELLFVSPP